MWDYTNTLFFPRNIYSSRKTSVPYSKRETNHGDFRSKAGGLASEKVEALDNLAKEVWIRGQQSDCVIKAISCRLSGEGRSWRKDYKSGEVKVYKC